MSLRFAKFMAIRPVNEGLTGVERARYRLASANDTIIGGAGVDTLVYTGRADTFTGGAGNDIFKIEADGTKALHLTITSRRISTVNRSLKSLILTDF